MKFPVIEIVDRYTIAIVKFEKTGGANREELEFYLSQIEELDVEKIDIHLSKLVEIHRQIWAMEDDFKKCRDDNFSLEELGRRSLAIRDLNNQRVALKNSMAAEVNDSVREIKQNHISQ